MIKVYALNMNEKEAEAILSKSASEEVLKKFEAYKNKTEKAPFNPETFQYYTLVAEVYTNDMKAAFERASNFHFQKKKPKMKRFVWNNVDTGDILETENGKRYRIEPYFNKTSTEIEQMFFADPITPLVDYQPI
jgi:hypothetical protein